MCFLTTLWWSIPDYFSSTNSRCRMLQNLFYDRREDNPKELISPRNQLEVTFSSSIRKQTTTLSPSNVVRPGNLSLRSVEIWAYPATTAHTVFERPGVTMLVCKVWTWHLSCTNSTMKALLIQSAIWVSQMMNWKQ